ncbi:GNAT family N-acetyltransferase [Paenibacillus sp. HJGM_3]|uniref:GNAT family N-acetyltransferase n=1 Tax=Paenibacillus sp. HJGM_3 TaxID=3379816 RepID=UPI00385D9BC3
MSVMGVTIRPAAFDDAEAIAQVHVASWRSTYKGILAEQFLTRLSVENRRKSWEWGFRNPNPDEHVYVAVDERAGIVGFANGGRERTGEYGFDGELYTVYLLPEYKGMGIGLRLVREIAGSLQRLGYRSLLVWVLEANPSAGFYARLGGKPIARKEITIGSDTPIEVAYGWSRLDDLLSGV